MAERVLGLLAEFGTADALLEATRQTRAAGYARIDAYTPYPVEGMAEALAIPRSDHRIGWITIAGGLFGFLGMLGGPAVRELGLSGRGRRPAAVRVAGLLRRRFRADDPVRGAVRGHRHVRHQSACPSCTIRCSARRASALPATTASSSTSTRSDPEVRRATARAVPRLARRVDDRAGAAMRIAPVIAAACAWRRATRT